MHYGADYNPEQWPEDLWPEDVARMREAGVTMVSLGIFAWARIQPREGEFDFGWLDRVIDLLHEGGIAVDLATATASPPPWASAAYPELLPQDEDGATYWPGSRQQFAPSSPVYRRLAAELVTAIAERYATHPAVVMWHVNNEYGCHLNMDFSDAARDAFRRWLADRYDGVDALNVAWGTDFWSQRYQSFDEVFPPRKAPYSVNPGQMLDYRRFTSDMLLECYLMEREIIRAAGASAADHHELHGSVQAGELRAVGRAPRPRQRRRLSRSERPRVVPGGGVPARPRAVAEARGAVDPDGAGDERPELAPVERAEGPGPDGRPQRAGDRAGRRRHPVLPVAAVPGGRREVPLGDAAAFGHRHAHVARVRRPRRAARRAARPSRRRPRRPRRAGVRLGELVGRRGIRPPVERARLPRRRAALVPGPAPAPRAGRHRAARARRRAVRPRDRTAAVPPPRQRGGRAHRLRRGWRPPARRAVHRHRRRGRPLPRRRLPHAARRTVRRAPRGLRRARGAGCPRRGARRAGGAVRRRAGDGRRRRCARRPVGTLLAEEIEATDATVEASFTSGRRAGHPALTARRAGRGVARYLATVPDEAGTQAVVDHVLADAGVEPVVAGLPEHVEAARRGELVTVVNHGGDQVDVAIAGTDAVSGERVESVRLGAFDWAMVLGR